MCSPAVRNEPIELANMAVADERHEDRAAHKITDNNGCERRDGSH